MAKIAVTAREPHESGPMDPRFGRCRYLIIFADDQQQEVMANKAAESVQGAGLAAARMVVDRGVEVLITGRVGPKAEPILNKAGVKVFQMERGTVEQALGAYQRGELSPQW